MAWINTLLDASFKGVVFDVMSVSRSGQRAIAVNEYPYTAGADLEDLNLHARRFRLKAICYGDNYEQELKNLIDTLESPGAGELVHPIHGSVQAMAESWEDSHEADLVDGAVLSISFIEHTTRDLVFSAAGSMADAIAAQAAQSRASADDVMLRWVEPLNGAPALRLTLLVDLFDQAKTYLRQLGNASGQNALLSDLDPILYPKAYAADLLSLVDRALQGMPFGGRNSQFDPNSGALVVVGSGLADFNTAARKLDPSLIVLVSTDAAPSADTLADTAVAQAHARVHAACTLAECAQIIFAAELSKALLDRADIEAIANRTRAAIQVAIDSARAGLDAQGRGQVSNALRALAYAIQQAALAVMNQRPPLVRRACPIDGPVRLVAHQLYGDASRAEEISRLNSLGRNVFIKRGEVLNVYAA